MPGGALRARKRFCLAWSRRLRSVASIFRADHEMEMCGHATLGTVWLLHRLGLLPARELTIATLSGVVSAQMRQGEPLVASRPGAAILDKPHSVLDVLGLRPADLEDLPVVNAATSRIKTLVPVRSRAILDSIAPDFLRLAAVCDDVGSTGLYPFAIVDSRRRNACRKTIPPIIRLPGRCGNGHCRDSTCIECEEARRPAQFRGDRAPG